MKEPLRPFAESGLWSALTEFYALRGSDAWASGAVPNRVTTNLWLADDYAEIVAAFVRDLEDAGDERRPLVVEIGSGNGLFGWHWTRRLAALLGDVSGPVDMLLTETSEPNVRAWTTIPRLATWLERARASLAVLSVDEDPPERVDSLFGPSVSLTDRPLVVIANYVLDALPTDMIRIRDGRIHREWLAVEGAVSTGEEGVPDLSGLELRTEARLVEHPYTGHPVVDGELDACVARGVSGCVPVPLRAIRFFERLAERARPFLLLVGDLGYTTDAFSQSVTLAHGAYVACATNFQLLGRVFERSGGASIHPRVDDTEFVAAAYIRHGKTPRPRCEEAARSRLLGCGPHDTLCLDERLQAESRLADLSAATVLAWLRLVRCDPVSVENALPQLDRIVEANDELDGSSMLRILQAGVEADLPELTGTRGLATKAALVLTRAGLYEGVLEVLEEVARDVRLAPGQLHLHALAQLRLGRTDAAATALTDLGVRAPGYWSGWPDGDEPATPAALAAVQDARHIDHVVLHLSVSMLIGEKGR